MTVFVSLRVVHEKIMFIMSSNPFLFSSFEVNYRSDCSSFLLISGCQFVTINSTSLLWNFHSFYLSFFQGSFSFFIWHQPVLPENNMLAKNPKPDSKVPAYRNNVHLTVEVCCKTIQLHCPIHSNTIDVFSNPTDIKLDCICSILLVESSNSANATRNCIVI